jgi:cytochrome d ubiquinol oxidase subunit I
MAYNDFDAEVKGINDLAEEQMAVIDNATSVQWTFDGTTAGEGNTLQTQAAQAGIIGNYLDESGNNFTFNPVPSLYASYYSFRVMLGAGGLAILIGLASLIMLRGDGTPKPTKLWTAMMIATPLLPLIANSGGWILAEMGRQPWIVYGVLPLEMAISHTVTAAEVLISMLLFTLVYAVVAVIVVKLFLSTIRHGLPAHRPVAASDADKPLSFAY